jgi:hypothetical protein
VPQLSISWDQIEKAYGRTLAADVRQRILETTELFAHFEVCERTVPPLQDAIDIVSKIRSAANSLQSAVGSFNGSTDAMSYSETLIKRHFREPRLKVPRDAYGPFNALSGVLTSLAVACNFALREMESPDIPGHREGEDWKNWIRSLTRIARDNDLPWQVSKGSDKSTQESPFTKLVAALHECVRKDARRHHHSNAAQPLTRLARRARGQNGTNSSRNPPEKVPPKVG